MVEGQPKSRTRRRQHIIVLALLIIVFLAARQGRVGLQIYHGSDGGVGILSGFTTSSSIESYIPTELASSLRAASSNLPALSSLLLPESERREESADSSIYIANATSASGRLYSLNTTASWHLPATTAVPAITAARTSAPAGPINFTIQRQPFDSFFTNGSEYQELNIDADKDGMVLDFAVIGYPKCGTTTMIANLGNIAPIPAADVCTPVYKTVWYAHKNWPREYGREKLLRGVKCPSIIDGFSVGPPILKDFSKYLPRTRLIVGIRHPVLWYQSFYNMQAGNNHKLPAADSTDFTVGCNKGNCGKGYCQMAKLFCLNRARFHLGLAELGKTPLDEAERELIPPELKVSDGNMIRNKIFLYDMEQLGDMNTTRRERLWSDLGDFIGYPDTIPHDKYKSSHGRGGARAERARINICDKRYDPIRAQLLVHGHQMSQWICPYFVKQGKDVYVSSQDYLCLLVEKYAEDPCGKLVRMDNGTYMSAEGSN